MAECSTLRVVVSLPEDRGAWPGLGHVTFELVSEHSGRTVPSEISHWRSRKRRDLRWGFRRPWCGGDGWYFATNESQRERAGVKTWVLGCPKLGISKQKWTEKRTGLGDIGRTKKLSYFNQKISKGKESYWKCGSITVRSCLMSRRRMMKQSYWFGFVDFALIIHDLLRTVSIER